MASSIFSFSCSLSTGTSALQVEEVNLLFQSFLLTEDFFCVRHTGLTSEQFKKTELILSQLAHNNKQVYQLQFLY